MNEADVAVILALANGHDQRHAPNDIKVRAWFRLFEQEAPDMEREWAMIKVNEHYAKTTDMLMPAHLVTAWKNKRRYERDRITTRNNFGTPMPEWFKTKMRESGVMNG